MALFVSMGSSPSERACLLGPRNSTAPPMNGPSQGPNLEKHPL